MLAGRPASWDAPTVHGDEVAILPHGALLLASNGVTQAQAAEIRYDRGVFWGVQYHLELAIGEVAVALRDQADDLVETGIAEDASQGFERADLLEALHRAPGKRSLRWMLGVDAEFAEEARRRTELGDFLTHLASFKADGSVAKAKAS